jgi:GDPmannose 4,6-dehydratase
MWLILQQDKPGDYVIGTGKSHSVRDFLELAFNYAGIELEWKGNGVDEKGIVKSIAKDVQAPINSGDVLIEIDPMYFRPTEVYVLRADISKANKELGWRPKVNFEELVKIMVDCDFKLFGVPVRGEGKKILLENRGISWTKNKVTIG